MNKTGKAALRTVAFPILESSLVNGDKDDEQSQNNTRPTLLNSLPEALIAEILSWAPIKTVFSCKAVSKHWLSAVDGSHAFPKTHLSRSATIPLLVFNDVLGRYPIRFLQMVEAREPSDLGNPNLVSKFEFPDTVKGPVSFVRHVNTKAVSCEGLICWATRQGAGDVLICNPVTREYVTFNFPNNPTILGYNDSAFIGLGFSLLNRRFELLKMVHGRMKIGRGRIIRGWWPEFCPVGSQTWQRAHTLIEPDFDFSRKVQEIFYVYGRMFWRYQEQASICSFDFNRHLLHAIPLPKFNGVTLEDDGEFMDCIRMGALGTGVSLTMISPSDGHVEIWALRRSAFGIAWYKIHYIQTLTTRFEHRGWLEPRGEYRTVVYMKSGKILIHDWRCSFLVYDIRTGAESFVRLVDHPDREGQLPVNFGVQALPYVPKMIPLKDTLNLKDESIVVQKAGPKRTTKRKATKPYFASPSYPRKKSCRLTIG